ncbi:THO complex subunit 4A-like [Miscanthus floridulus]|uniref:THO complex subunit 4A-like n=1 Tax=Miscanthus floridulus TaxID=154761 RepID=UPI00345788AF
MPSTCLSTTSSPRAGAPTNAHAGEALPPEAEIPSSPPTAPRRRFNTRAAATPYLRRATYSFKELFSDVGDIKRYSINYDRSGRSKGTAEVIFSRRSDALAVVKRYNNVLLDGKPMKIEIIGTNIEAPPPPTAIFFNPPARNFNLPFKSWPGRGCWRMASEQRWIWWA